jgi:hypothetical protein
VRRALIAGLALGVVTRFAYHLPEDWWWLARVGAPWLAVAFAVGASTPRLRAGAARGAVSLVVAILEYYAILGLIQHAYDHSPLGLWWLAAAVPGGAAYGALGALWRAGRHDVLAAAVLSASLAGEALIFVLLRSDGRLAGPALFALAAALPVLLVRDGHRRVRVAALATVLTLAAVVAEVVVIRATGYVS